MAEVHGGVTPVWLQGSRVTYIVAPTSGTFAFFIATTSAWSGDATRW